MKLILIEGVGFGEQNHLLNELSLYSIEAKSYDIDQPFSAEFKAQVEAAGWIVFRSRWSATVEESVFIKTLLKKHHAYFEALDELVKEKKVKVIGIGRGALLWLSWLEKTKKIESALKWTPETFMTNSWVDTKVYTNSDTSIVIRAMVSGRAFLLRPNTGGMSTKTWVKIEDREVGWVFEEAIYLSLVDVLSLSERAQLPDFGYEDLSAISTRSNLIQKLLAGEM
jgi:hypothetical protein